MTVFRAAFFALLISIASSWVKTGSADQSNTRLDSLFSQLQATSSETEARALEKLIWEIWLESGDELVDRLMLGGVEAMGGGDYEKALAAERARFRSANRCFRLQLDEH